MTTTGSDELDAATLAGWRTAERAGNRARQASLGRQAAEQATLAGVLLDLGEQGVPVVVDVLGGHRRVGRVLAVTPACVVLGLDAWAQALVDLAAVRCVRQAPTRARGALGSGDRVVTSIGDGSIGEVLGGLVHELPELHVTFIDGTSEHGTLASAGTDVVVLSSMASPTTSLVHVSLRTVADVVVRGASWT